MNVNTGIKQALVLAFGIIARQGELLEKGIAIVDGGYDNPVKYEYVAFR